MSRISVGDLGKPTALTVGLIINCIEQVVRTTEIHAIKKKLKNQRWKGKNVHFRVQEEDWCGS
jgi:hypothetical protein